MTERHMPKKLKITGGVFLGANIALASVSQAYLEDPLAMHQISSDYISSVPQLAQEVINQDTCEITSIKTREGINSNIDFDITTNKAKKHEAIKMSAENFDLTLVDESPYLEEIHTAETHDEVLGALNDYSENHNLKFSFPEEFIPRDFPVEYSVLNLNKLDLDKLKEMSSQLLEDLYPIPLELSTYSDEVNIKIVDEINLATLMKFSPNASFRQQLIRNEDVEIVGGFTNPITKNIFVSPRNLSNLSFSKRILHEKSHTFLFKYCGILGSINDNEFGSLNPDEFEYKNEALMKEYPEISSSKYGYEAVYEDAAYIMTDLIFFRENIDQLSDVQKEKAKLILSRIDQVVPGYAEYWLELKNN